MILIPKNSNYVNPITGEIIENIFVSDGEFSDIPLLKKLKISFWLCQNYETVEFVEKEGVLTPEAVSKIKVLDTDTLEFTPDNYMPTYVTLGNETKDLFIYLSSGGKLDGTETIEVGSPDYTSIQGYLLKDNIGDALVFNPTLDATGLQLAKAFVLKSFKLNGEALGVQFKFEE